MKRIMNVVVAVVMIGMAVVAGMAVKQSIDWHTKYNVVVDELKDVQDSYDELQYTVDHQTFDTSVIEQWCGDPSVGQIRMVGAWLAEASVIEGQGTVLTLEDEQGELWLVDNLSIAQDETVLLWIADNNTTDDKTDDIIIKVYTEVHE